MVDVVFNITHLQKDVVELGVGKEKQFWTILVGGVSLEILSLTD